MRLRRRAGISDGAAVMTSPEVLEEYLPVTRVFRFADGNWACLSGQEEDDSRPTWVHFSHIAELDRSLRRVRLHPGEYVLRTWSNVTWRRFGPIDDDHLDEMLITGRIDDQQNEMERIESMRTEGSPTTE